MPRRVCNDLPLAIWSLEREGANSETGLQRSVFLLLGGNKSQLLTTA
jgi:hypothetical protein